MRRRHCLLTSLSSALPRARPLSLSLPAWLRGSGNWRVVRHRPTDGAIDHVIKLPFNNPSSCCIGGQNLDRLFITSARHRLSDEEVGPAPPVSAVW